MLIPSMPISVFPYPVLSPLVRDRLAKLHTSRPDYATARWLISIGARCGERQGEAELRQPTAMRGGAKKKGREPLCQQRLLSYRSAPLWGRTLCFFAGAALWGAGGLQLRSVPICQAQLARHGTAESNALQVCTPCAMWDRACSWQRDGK